MNRILTVEEFKAEVITLSWFFLYDHGNGD